MYHENILGSHTIGVLQYVDAFLPLTTKAKQIK